MDFNVKTRELIVDTSDCHGNIKAPSETGKTTVHLIPNIQYNMYADTSIILPDLKGELKCLTEEDAIRLGYKTFTFNFVNLVDSATIDLFDDIYKNMELYLRTDDVIAKASSESYYICHPYVNKDGKNTTKTHARLSTLKELSEKLNTDRDGVLAWAKEKT